MVGSVLVRSGQSPGGYVKAGPRQLGQSVPTPHRLKENYILLSTDGPGRNVLKFKPPMCFSKANAEHVVAKLDAILTGELSCAHTAPECSADPPARVPPDSLAAVHGLDRCHCGTWA